MQLWGIADTTKAWWQMEQAITGGLEMYRTTNDQKYLNMADESLDFFMTYFQDAIYGEVYADRTRRGAGIPQWGDHKGDSNKAAYHSIELGYYTYLYAHLFVNYTPAKLYYFFDESNENRTITLSPISDGPTGYSVKSVTLDGAAYTDFSATNRTLAGTAGTHGLFAVVFGVARHLSSETIVAQDFILESLYPNPTTERLSLRYSTQTAAVVRVRVFDMLGRQVSEPMVEFHNPGIYTKNLSLPNVSPGVYAVSIEQGPLRLVRSFIVTK